MDREQYHIGTILKKHFIVIYNNYILTKLFFLLFDIIVDYFSSKVLMLFKK